MLILIELSTFHYISLCEISLLVLSIHQAQGCPLLYFKCLLHKYAILCKKAKRRSVVLQGEYTPAHPIHNLKISRRCLGQKKAFPVGNNQGNRQNTLPAGRHVTDNGAI